MNKPLENTYLAAPENSATPASLSKHTARWNISPANYPQPNIQSRSSVYIPMECYDKSICQIIWTGNMALTTLNEHPLTAVCCVLTSGSLSQSLTFRYRRPSGPPVFILNSIGLSSTFVSVVALSNRRTARNTASYYGSPCSCCCAPSEIAFTDQTFVPIEFCLAYLAEHYGSSFLCFFLALLWNGRRTFDVPKYPWSCLKWSVK